MSLAVDSSVVVAGCAAWHEHHEAAREALARRPRPIAHCTLEAFSVLTRLPPAHRPPTAAVVEVLRAIWESDDPLVLPPARLARLVPDLVALGIEGGAVYDGLVALTAAEHGVTLLSLDRRAAVTYRRCGTDYRILA